MELYIQMILHELGIRATYTGYRYMIDAIKVALDEKCDLGHITKDIYPEVAKRNRASVWMIETNLRAVIERCWKRTNPENIEKYFPGRSGQRRPTNTEFLEGIVRYMTRHDEEGWGLEKFEK